MAAAAQPSVSVVHADAPSAVVAFASARAREALARLGASKHKELAEDVKRLLPWIEWAYDKVKNG
jgi:hypothetical protein